MLSMQRNQTVPDFWEPGGQDGRHLKQREGEGSGRCEKNEQRQGLQSEVTTHQPSQEGLGVWRVGGLQSRRHHQGWRGTWSKGTVSASVWGRISSAPPLLAQTCRDGQPAGQDVWGQACWTVG